MNRRTIPLAANLPCRATPLFSVPLQASETGKGLHPIPDPCCRFGGTADLSRLRSGGPNKVRAEGPFDIFAVDCLVNAPLSENAVGTIRPVVAHELALMLIRTT